MLRFFILLALTTVVFLQVLPAFCGASQTTSFQLSVTIPEHVISKNNSVATPLSNNPYQLAQTQIVTRNNKTISLTSIVVP